MSRRHPTIRASRDGLLTRLKSRVEGRWLLMLLVLPLMLLALVPRGYMFSASAAESDSVTFPIVFCSLHGGVVEQQFTMESEATPPATEHSDRVCPYALLAAALASASFVGPAFVALSAPSCPSFLPAARPRVSARLRPAPRAPPRFIPA